MIQIAIVEDCEEDYLQLKNITGRYFNTIQEKYCITHFGDAESFLFSGSTNYDLVFMDIDLPGISGMEAARKIREKDTIIALIFLTNLAQYAINGYEVDALDYMLKPLNYCSFSLKMPKVIHFIQANIFKEININTKNTIQRLSISQIYYVEIISHQLFFHTDIGTFETRGTMQELEKTLENSHFMRCNNCYLVNFRHISGIYKNEVFIGQDHLPISRSRKKEFLNEFTHYIGGEI